MLLQRAAVLRIQHLPCLRAIGRSKPPGCGKAVGREIRAVVTTCARYGVGAVGQEDEDLDRRLIIVGRTLRKWGSQGQYASAPGETLRVYPVAPGGHGIDRRVCERQDGRSHTIVIGPVSRGQNRRPDIPQAVPLASHESARYQQVVDIVVGVARTWKRRPVCRSSVRRPRNMAQTAFRQLGDRAAGP
jgi:hypothetical protein